MYTNDTCACTVMHTNMKARSLHFSPIPLFTFIQFSCTCYRYSNPCIHIDIGISMTRESSTHVVRAAILMCSVDLPARSLCANMKQENMAVFIVKTLAHLDKIFQWCRTGFQGLSCCIHILPLFIMLDRQY